MVETSATRKPVENAHPPENGRAIHMSSPRCVRFAGAVTAVVVSAILSIPGIAFSQTPAATTVDRVSGWRSDIVFWLDQLRKQHYVYKSKPLPASLITAADNLSRNIPK